MNVSAVRFYEELFDAKVRYVTTRQFWDERPRRELASDMGFVTAPSCL